MKKFAVVFVAFVALCDAVTAFDAVTKLTPKKANSVAKHEETSSVTNIGGSLLPTAMGLVGNVMALNKQQQELVAECEPTQKEITFVNNLVKEWAIAGAANPFDTYAFGQVYACVGEPYQDVVANMDSSMEVEDLCYDAFTDAEARGAVWAGFPKAAVATICPDGSTYCASNKQKKVTNMYEIFGAIDFTEADYTKSEAAQATALMEKAAKCSSSQIAAKRLESFGGFVTNAIGSMGQKTNTTSVMETVTSTLGSSGLSGLVGSFGGVAGQLLDR